MNQYDFRFCRRPLTVRAIMIAISGLHPLLVQHTSDFDIDWLMKALPPLVATQRIPCDLATNVADLPEMTSRVYFPAFAASDTQATIFEEERLPRYFAWREPIMVFKPTCPCGNWGSTTKQCLCAPETQDAYQAKMYRMSAQFDLVLNLEHTTPRETPGETTEQLKLQLHHAEEFRGDRKPAGTLTNEEALKLNLTRCEPILWHINNRDELVDYVPNFARVARTIADLMGEEHIQIHHLAEAVQWRPRLWTPW